MRVVFLYHLNCGTESNQNGILTGFALVFAIGVHLVKNWSKKKKKQKWLRQFYEKENVVVNIHRNLSCV